MPCDSACFAYVTQVENEGNCCTASNLCAIATWHFLVVHEWRSMFIQVDDAAGYSKGIIRNIS